MPISYQEQAQLTCPACGADFEAAIWLILDAEEQPAATDALRASALNIVACPSCGNRGPAGAPLLFHHGAARRVIFAGAPGAAEHEIRDQARDLHAILVGSIPEEQRRPYLVDVDIAQDLAGVAHLLKRIERRMGGQGDKGTRGPGDKGTLSTETSPLVPPAPGARGEPSPAPQASEAGDAPPPLLLAVQELLAANTPEELQRILAARPVLLDPSTDTTLAQLAEVAREQRAYAIAESLQHARTLLTQMGGQTDPGTPAAAGPIPEAALQLLLAAQSAAELIAAVEAHPALLHPEADRILAERIELALDEGNDRLAHALEERREALNELRQAQLAAEAPHSSEPTIEEAIEALLIADGEAAMVEAIDRYPVLLEDVAAQALWQFAAEARAGGDEEMARYAIECRELLRRVREGLA